MEKTCYRCDAPLAADAPFCPACGAPQIRVTSPELTPASPEPQSEPPAVTFAPPAQAFEPGAIRWKPFLRTAWPLALLAGISASFNAIGLLILLPLSVLLGCLIYRKRHVGPLRATQGMKLGLAMGLMSFAAFAAFAGTALVVSGAVRNQLVESFKQAATRSPDPQAQQIMLSWVNNPHQFAILMVFGFVFLMFIFLVLTGLTGAVVAASLGGKKA